MDNRRSRLRSGRSARVWLLVAGMLLAACGGALLAACGGGSDSDPPPSVEIDVPTTAPTFSTQAAAVRLGGSIARASFVAATNQTRGITTQGFVNYFQGQGTWFVDVDLQMGVNVIVVTADADGTGRQTATDRIDVTRMP